MAPMCEMRIVESFRELGKTSNIQQPDVGLATTSNIQWGTPGEGTGPTRRMVCDALKVAQVGNLLGRRLAVG
jgi:hypothetical protein